MLFIMIMLSATLALYGMGTFMLAKDLDNRIQGVLAILVAILLAAIALDNALICNPN